jgi:type 1 glutamine amidotransferase
MARRKLFAGVLLALLVLGSLAGRAQSSKLQLLIITGSHQQAHDWYNSTPVLKKVLEDTGRFAVTVTQDPVKDLTPTELKKYQVLLLHYHETPAGRPQREPILDDHYVRTGEFKEFPPMPGRWPAANEKALLDAVSGGTGLVVIHYATGAFDIPAEVNWPEYETLVGGGWRDNKNHSGHGPQFQFKVKITNHDHPITKGFPAEFLHAKDELYHNSLMIDGNTVLATAFDDPVGGVRATASGHDEPMLWVHQYGKGRVYTTVLGHGPDQIRLSPGYISLLQRGAEWAATGKVTIPIPKNLDAPVDANPVDVPGRGRGANGGTAPSGGGAGR